MRMIRKIILLLLVLGICLQGVNAYSTEIIGDSYRLTVDSSDPGGWYCYNPVEIGAFPGVYYSVAANGDTGSLKFFISESTCGDGGIALTDFIADSSGESGYVVPADHNLMAISKTGSSNQAGVFIMSASVPDTISGISCDGEGVFDFYMNGSLIDSDSTDGNYSFIIWDDIDYQIHFTDTDISEWHNFTASGDETWNPTCYTCTPPGIELTTDEDALCLFCEGIWPPILTRL